VRGCRLWRRRPRTTGRRSHPQLRVADALIPGTPFGPGLRSGTVNPSGGHDEAAHLRWSRRPVAVRTVVGPGARTRSRRRWKPAAARAYDGRTGNRVRFSPRLLEASRRDELRRVAGST